MCGLVSTATCLLLECVEVSNADCHHWKCAICGKGYLKVSYERQCREDYLHSCRHVIAVYPFARLVMANG